MGEARLVTREDGTVEPAPGWKWCPYCNGEGVVFSMQATPDLDEVAHECGFCDDGLAAS